MSVVVKPRQQQQQRRPSASGRVQVPLENEGEGETEDIDFAVIALRDLRAGEEIVRDWEWDDRSAVHRVGALGDAG